MNNRFHSLTYRYIDKAELLCEFACVGQVYLIAKTLYRRSYKGKAFRRCEFFGGTEGRTIEGIPCRTDHTYKVSRLREERNEFIIRSFKGTAYLCVGAYELLSLMNC